MIEQVIRYKTNDGHEFSTIKEAEKYIENFIQENLNELLKKHNYASYRDLMATIQILAGDMTKIHFLYSMLGSMMRGLDDRFTEA